MGRDFNHDYRSRCIYHITIGKAPACPDFSSVSGSASQPLVERSPIGDIIEDQINNLSKLCPALQVQQYVIMPDHLHIALYAHDRLPRAVGCYIGMMKVKCGQLARASFPAVSDIFVADFHDRHLRPTHSLPDIIKYIQLNPSRLLVRRANPDFFRKINNISLNGALWQAYGNLHLLDNPFKAQVVVHRVDSPTLRADNQRRWRHLAENGGVLVSPFISPDEQQVRRMCEDVGGKAILLNYTPLAPREKPSAHNFDLCSQGRLLILAPMQPMPPGRATFLALNAAAEAIAEPH